MAPGEKRPRWRATRSRAFGAWLIEGGVAETELALLEAAIDREIDEAVAFALESPLALTLATRA
jgi:pyruvate dehydrogenase E1 component alpha subunit